MPADATTFYLAFSALFLGLGLFLFRLERMLRRIEERLAVVESEPGRHPDGGDA